MTSMLSSSLLMVGEKKLTDSDLFLPTVVPPIGVQDVRWRALCPGHDRHSDWYEYRIYVDEVSTHMVGMVRMYVDEVSTSTLQVVNPSMILSAWYDSVLPRMFG